MRVINPPNDIKPIGPYSTAVCASNLLFTSGRIGIDPTSDKLVDGGLESEIKQVISNISISLHEVKLDLNDIMKATAYLRKSEKIEEFLEIFKSYLGEAKFVCTVVQVDWLPENALIQIEVVAALTKDL